MSSNERRRGYRFDMRLTCRVSFPRKASDKVSGTTQDVSRSGLLILFPENELPKVPAVGDMARIVLDLPKAPDSSPKCLDCMARVVRINDAELGHRLVAFEVRSMRFTGRNEPDSSGEETPSELAGSGYFQ